MKDFRFVSLSTTVVLLTALMVVAPAIAQGRHREKVLFSFSAIGDLSNTPNGALISDGAGNFYGANVGDGLGSSAIFEISSKAGGGWTARSIHVFSSLESPGGGLVMDSSGNLYGVLYSGGNKFCTDGFGDYSCGAVYELSPNGSGGWSERILWNASETEGWRPWSLVMGPDGNLYGTTACTLEACGGTVYELQRSGENWTHVVLVAFGAPESNGGQPEGPLVFDQQGNIYGATFGGGAYAGGVVFELKKTSSFWKEISLFQFQSSGSGASGGWEPGPVIFDSAGNLYGTTYSAGDSFQQDGVAFELTPNSSGIWSETVLHTFLFGLPGGYALGSLVLDSTGNLDGTASFGGSEGFGTIFQLNRTAGGAWSEGLLHSFGSSPEDGKYPNGLLLAPDGNLYGTTSGGGAEGVGTVFEITQ